MPVELWVALIGALATIMVGVGGGVVALYAPDWKARGDRRRKLNELEGRYRDAILLAAFDLQGRLYNIVSFGFLDRTTTGTEERSYAEMSTLWRIGRYFGWTELLRRDLYTTSAVRTKRARQLVRLLSRVSQLFATDSPELGQTLRLFREQQSALGEGDDARAGVGRQHPP